MPTYRLHICYDGTDFCGWQRQLNGPSVQAALEEALGKVLKEPVICRAAGRTDSGVHALGQVVSIRLPREIPEKALVYGTNNHLPDSVAVVSAQLVDDSFDARHSSSGKLYRYQIWNGNIRSPLHCRNHWHVGFPLDLEKMRAAAEVLVGRHDFRAFRAADCERETTVRTMKRIDVLVPPHDPAAIYIEVEGTAFLKNMVRILSGTIVAAGRGLRSTEEIATLLKTGDRTRAGQTAPACGLLLVRVDYGKREGP
ncbi:MAG TPA: tRNA pseudouridine(38-40) synthase TruA [Pseudomonadota bacterium]|nr:tRNA pseudouridine(38-40) synthase TruA [Pseudomonadota bacterium]HNK46062.1 tRNA pseudouridine(38-40) synthase TruA [Pseudomonadota bacterium]